MSLFIDEGKVIEVKDKHPSLEFLHIVQQPIVPRNIVLVLSGPDPYFLFGIPAHGTNKFCYRFGIVYFSSVYMPVIITASQHIAPPLPALLHAFTNVNVI